MTTPIVELRQVSKSYVGVDAVRDVSLALVPGQIHCLLGENGAGKSTVIKIVTGVESPSSGEVIFDGAPVQLSGPADARRRGVATVFQDVGSLPLMSVGRNFVIGAEPLKGRGLFRRIDLEVANREAVAALKALGIQRVNDGRQLVGKLSGGERQALAIARAVHFGARVLVLDEPTAALGVRESAMVMRLLMEVKKRGVAILLVTHNSYQAHVVGDGFTILRRGALVESFSQGAKSAQELAELMAGGAEFASLLNLEE